MGKRFERIEDAHARFIAAQHVFFVATAAADGRVNVSPKGMKSLIVDGPNRILWRNLTGSGNETAGHLRQVNRMTLMWCAFERRPMILRAYGTARTLHSRDPDWVGLNGRFPPKTGARQIYDMAVEMVQVSCGYGVPLMDFRQDRDALDTWALDKGRDGIREYWAERNSHTIDGTATGVLDDEA